MARLSASWLMILAFAAAPAQAGSTMLSGGVADWFNACGARQPMNIAILHADRSVTQFSLAAHQRTRSLVRRGDMVSWSCGGAVLRTGEFHYVITLTY